MSKKTVKVMVCGPMGSGKTAIALSIRKHLGAIGIQCHVGDDVGPPAATELEISEVLARVSDVTEVTVHELHVNRNVVRSVRDEKTIPHVCSEFLARLREGESTSNTFTSAFVDADVRQLELIDMMLEVAKLHDRRIISVEEMDNTITDMESGVTMLDEEAELSVFLKKVMKTLDRGVQFVFFQPIDEVATAARRRQTY